MKPRSYTSEGIVLARRSYGEEDRILAVYSKLHGRVSLIAKGVRKLRSKKRGHIEIFNKISFQAVSGNSLDIMTEAIVIDDLFDLKKNLKKVSLAYYFMEVIGKITHEGEANYEVYNILQQSLQNLKKTKELKKLRFDFILRLLTVLGYWPNGKALPNPDEELEKVIERNLSSFRVGKILSS